VAILLRVLRRNLVLRQNLVLNVYLGIGRGNAVIQAARALSEFSDSRIERELIKILSHGKHVRIDEWGELAHALAKISRNPATADLLNRKLREWTYLWYFDDLNRTDAPNWLVHGVERVIDGLVCLRDATCVTLLVLLSTTHAIGAYALTALRQLDVSRVRISEIVDVKASIATGHPGYGEDFGQHIDGELRRLVELHDPRVVPSLIEALRHRSVWVKRAAIESLAEIGDPRAIGPLKEKLADWTGHRYSGGEGDWRVSGIAAWALKRIDAGAHDQSSK
jgi:hypothetical protein